MTEKHWLSFQAAYRSYNAMETTKRRHFDYLTLLERKKKKFNLDPTAEETELLRLLLRDHDEEVRSFKCRCDSLKSSDPPAYTALFEYLAQINNMMAPIGQSNGH